MAGLSRDPECLQSDLLWYDRRRLLPAEQDQLDLTALVSSRHKSFSRISFSHIDAILIANVSADEAAELTVNSFDDASTRSNVRRTPVVEEDLTLRAAMAKLLVHRADGWRGNGWPTSDASTARLTLKNSSLCDVRYCIAILGKSVAMLSQNLSHIGTEGLAEIESDTT